MALPFKLNAPVVEADDRANVGRSNDGKFRSLPQTLPHAIRKQAEERDEYAGDVAREHMVPDRLVGDSGSSEEVPGARPRSYAAAIPWPPAGPINDAGRPPMKLKD